MILQFDSNDNPTRIMSMDYSTNGFNSASSVSMPPVDHQQHKL
eukprot:CAMPEP_0171051770 /NCGR_PEP_ID=MMETSP0736-20130129/53304_1 /TAXON_ID=186038 /ORGANISM="Fragilariopsis kerguelensis, Strain L26-C5" /LENGTH=42 /DNA_ID= /DNA_START= /DNA_END= /DNA_ORIENTATION=